MDQARCLTKHLGHILAGETIGQELQVLLSKMAKNIIVLHVENFFSKKILMAVMFKRLIL